MDYLQYLCEDLIDYIEEINILNLIINGLPSIRRLLFRKEIHL